MILKKSLCVSAVFAGLWGAAATQATARPQDVETPRSCDAAFAALFTPERPLVGRYEVCTDARPLADVAPTDYVVETADPRDAFGDAGSYDRARLAQLYGTRRVRVARGWTEAGDRFESIILISPYPDATLTTLEPGTLVIRWICDRDGGQCKMLNAAR